MGPGRRVSAGEDRRNPVNSRIRNALRERLEQAAENAGRTLSHEIEERLERSFDKEDDVYNKFGDEKNLAIVSAIVSSWMLLELMAKKPWTSNYETIAMARRAANSVLDLVTPANQQKPELKPLARLGEHNDTDMLSDLSAQWAVWIAQGKNLPQGLEQAILETSQRAFAQRPAEEGDEK